MGNCADSCFGSIRRKSNKNYFSGRYKDYNVGIEFESLIEDDLTQQTQLAAVNDRERDHLLNQRYSDLIQDQKRKDAEIDAELQQQEENIRLEEEAYIAAKRESSRAAHQARALEQQRSSKPIANGTAKSSWLGENESEWHVLWEKCPTPIVSTNVKNEKKAGGEDDFEMFLESVKARSKTVRANAAYLFDFRRRGSRRKKLKNIDSLADLEWEYEEGMAPNPYNSNARNAQSDHTTNANPKGGSVSTQEPSSSEPLESDSDFEPEFVGAETIVEQAQVQDEQLTNENIHVASQISPAQQNPVTIENAQGSNNQNTAPVLDGKITPKIVDETDSGIKTSLEITVDQSREKPSTASVITDKIIPDVAQENINSDTLVVTKENNDVKATESSENLKSATEDDPFDFDKFLEELDL